MKNITFSRLDTLPKEQKKAAYTILHYKDKLSKLDPVISEQIAITDAEGRKITHDNDELLSQDFSISVPNNASFLKFLSVLESHHEIKIPKIKLSKEQQYEKETYCDFFKKMLPSDTTFKKKDVEFLYESDAEALSLYAEALRDIANDLHEKQEKLASRKEALVHEYLATGNEDVFRKMIALNDEMTELAHEQETLSDIFKEVYSAYQSLEAEGASSPELEANIELTNRGVERNVMHEKTKEELLVNTSELREEYTSKSKGVADNTFSF